MKLSWKHLAWAAGGSLLILASGAVVVGFSDATYRERVSIDLSHSVGAAVAATNPADLQKLTGSAQDVSSPEYVGLRRTLSAIASVFYDQGLRGLYAMRIVDRKPVFLADSAPIYDAWHSEPGVVYREPPPELLETSRDGLPRFAGPYTDEYGTYYSTFAAVFEHERVQGVMGADIEKATYDADLNRQRLPVVALTLLLVFIYLSLYTIAANRRAARRLARQYMLKLDRLIEQMPLGVVMTDAKMGKPTVWNRKAQELLGRAIDPAAGADFFAETYGLLHENGTPFSSGELPLKKTIATSSLSSLSPVFIPNADGTKSALRMACVPIVDERGKVTAALLVIEDMTVEYAIDREKSELVSIASHQLRSPLSIIKWNAEMLLDKSEGELFLNQQQYVQHIRSVNEQMIGLVNDLLNLSRLEAGKVRLNPVLTDVTELMGEVVRQLAPLQAEKQLRIEEHKEVVPKIMADPMIIRQVIMNLMANAVKYTPPGGHIRVEAAQRGDAIRVAVIDTGLGIPNSQQSNIFKKFFRASNVENENADGTGLGLYFCKQAVEMSGGQIGFESTEGVGSTFWFTLPTTPTAASASQA